jgi:hypothetical protein
MGTNELLESSFSIRDWLCLIQAAALLRWTSFVASLETVRFDFAK